MTYKKAFAFLALGSFGVAWVLGGAGFMFHRAHHLECEDPVPFSEIEPLTVSLPTTSKVCKKTAQNSGRLQMLAAEPSALCIASFANVGCPELRSTVMPFVTSMANEGWATERVEWHGTDGYVEFQRKTSRASLHLRRTNVGEIEGELDVFLDGPKHAKQ